MLNQSRNHAAGQVAQKKMEVYIMANTYNYLNAVAEDVREYINNEIDLNEWRGDRDGLEEKLNNDLWIEDSVTGNASGSYTFSTWQAEEYLAHNWEVLEEALAEFGNTENPIEKGAEWCDVTIRCYLLGQARVL